MGQVGHNSGDVDAQSLRQYIERIERLREDIGALQSDLSEVYKEAKGTGLDTKIMKMLVAERAKDQATLDETTSLLDVYRSAVAAGN